MCDSEEMLRVLCTHTCFYLSLGSTKWTHDDVLFWMSRNTETYLIYFRCFFRLQFKSSIVCVCILHRSYKQYILYMDFSWISYSNVHRFLSELLLWLNDNFSMVCPSCGIFHWLTLWVSHGFRLYKVAVLWTGQRNQIYSH